MRSTMTARAMASTLAALAAGVDVGLLVDRGSEHRRHRYTIWDPYPQFDDGSDWVEAAATSAAPTRA